MGKNTEAGSGLVGEEVGKIISGSHKGHTDLVIFNTITHEKVTALDMLHALVLLVVIRAMNGRLIVNGHVDRLITRCVKLTKES